MPKSKPHPIRRKVTREPDGASVYAVERGPSLARLNEALALGVKWRAACLSDHHETIASTLEPTFGAFRLIRHAVRNTDPNAAGYYDAVRERPLWRAFLAGICDVPMASLPASPTLSINEGD